MEKHTSKEERDQKSRMEAQERLDRRTSEIEGSGYTMGFEDKLKVANIPWGWEYHWGRQHSKGYDDNPRMAYLGKRGWTAVPPERHPELCFGVELAGAAKSSHYIYNDGLILLERPMKFGDMEREQISKHNMKMMNEMPGISNIMGEPGIPLKFIADPSAQRGPSSF